MEPGTPAWAAGAVTIPAPATRRKVAAARAAVRCLRMERLLDATEDLRAAAGVCPEKARPFPGVLFDTGCGVRVVRGGWSVLRTAGPEPPHRVAGAVSVP
ncbi:hypothetical protein GCM10010272_05940 [Streptomyces lateritius]|nr:hypothetical protein GCM10010272_05940 [Streptomyces lateritius]